MANDLLALLIRVNLVGSCAILAVLVLRRLRGALDADARVWLWMVLPAVAIALLIPREDVSAPAAVRALPGLPAHTAGALVAFWLGGAVLALIALGCLQWAFLRAARRGRAGPAVVGLACPRIVMPSTPAFEADERVLIRAHEREHISRNDLGVRSLLAFAQCVFWFNPLMHVAAAALRLDQEIACDEAVLRIMGRRRLYAETLLKSHTARPAPFGCQWPARGRHPLEARLAALASPPVGEVRRAAGMAFVLMTAMGVALATWLTGPTQPPRPSIFSTPDPLVILVDLTPPKAAAAFTKGPRLMRSRHAQRPVS